MRIDRRPLRRSAALALAAVAGLTFAPGARAEPTSPALRELNGAITQLVAKVSPAVVQIRATGYAPVGDLGGPEGPVLARQHSVGSGVIVDADGYVVTNEHVVRGAQRIQVVVPGIAATGKHAGSRQRIFQAKVVGAQPSIDLALLKVDASGLPTLPLTSISKVEQGEIVFAVGSPQGLESTVTMGVVSSAARQIDTPTPLAIPMLLIQTDAPINPGNSGGPLVDSEGALVGLNTFILSQSGGSQGLGFAIPAAMVRFAVDNLRKYGYVRRIEAGVTAVAVTPVIAAGLGLSRDWGVVVADVTPGGAAAAAGLRPGDVIDAFDGRPIDSLPALTSALFLHAAGGPVELKVLRGETPVTLRIDAPEAPAPTDRLADLASPDKGLLSRLGVIGVEVDEKLQAILPPLRIPSGVVVAARTLGPAGATLALQPGDVIHGVNRTPITSLDDLRRTLHAFQPGDAVVLHVERQGRLNYLAFEIE